MFNLKFLKVYNDRGVMRYYFRRKGYPELALPGEPLSQEWMNAYHAAMSNAPAQPKTRYEVGSIADSLLKWYASTGFKSLEPKTRHHYRQMIERELKEHMHKPIRRLEPHHVQGWIDDMDGRPGAANSLLKRLKTFFRFCASPRSKILKSNPAQYVEPIRYETNGFPAWDETDAAAYELKWPIGTKQFTAFALITYTGQRISDIAKMGRQDISDGRIAVVQTKLRKGKKRVKLQIPLHPKLSGALQAYGYEARMIFLQTQYNLPYSAKGLSQDFSQWANDAGLDVKKAAHGVRKLAGARLAEAGCSEKEIMSILGISSLKEAALYTESARQKKLADGAMKKYAGTDDGQKVSVGKSVQTITVKYTNKIKV